VENGDNSDFVRMLNKVTCVPTIIGSVIIIWGRQEVGGLNNAQLHSPAYALSGWLEVYP
jgi:hypothetical protein